MSALTHLSPNDQAVIVVESRTQQERGFKPTGFWYEVDGDWERWCRDEGWVNHDQTHLYEVILGDENMLRLGDYDEIRAFTEAFRCGSRLYEEHVDWLRVAEKWDGLEIAPYVWEARLDLFWYYEWDCASGVVWHPKGIRVERVMDESD